MRILVTGGSGLLGQELQKYYPEANFPSHDVLDITKTITDTTHYDLIIHAAAYTDVVKAETEKGMTQCWSTNVFGTWNLIKAFPQTPIVLISSEYAHNPVNFYGQSKAAAERIVKKYAVRYLIIRTLFKPAPFPFSRAFIDQYTQGDYVDTIAPLIVESINNWKKRSKTMYVGTGRKTIFELAKRTRPDVKPLSIRDITTVRLPGDYL